MSKRGFIHLWRTSIRRRLWRGAMANTLMSELAAHGAAPHRVEVVAEAADGEVRTRTWRNRDPFDADTLAERVRWQLNAWLDGARLQSGPGIRGGLVRLRIAPADVSDRGRQLALTEDARSVADAERALIQTQAIVGIDGVVQAKPRGGENSPGTGCLVPMGRGSPRIRSSCSLAWTDTAPVSCSGSPGAAATRGGGMGRRLSQSGTSRKQVGRGDLMGGAVARHRQVVAWCRAMRQVPASYLSGSFPLRSERRSYLPRRCV